MYSRYEVNKKKKQNGFFIDNKATFVACVAPQARPNFILAWKNNI